MKVAIISSSMDFASSNIKESLVRLFGFKKTGELFCNNEILEYNCIRIYTINGELIFAEGIDNEIGADFFIFASKHRSKENVPSFTVHPIGNFGNADFGGKERKLCPSSAILLKCLFVCLNENLALFKKEEIFQATMEATHHGPCIKKPAVFVEIGSTEKEWKDTQNGEVIARTIIKAIEMFRAFLCSNKWVPTLILGGSHYAQSSNRAMLGTDYAIGHICPKHMLDKLDEETLSQAISCITPKPQIVLLDWKGLGHHKQKVILLLDNLRIRHERV